MLIGAAFGHRCNVLVRTSLHEKVSQSRRHRPTDATQLIFAQARVRISRAHARLQCFRFRAPFTHRSGMRRTVVCLNSAVEHQWFLPYDRQSSTAPKDPAKLSFACALHTAGGTLDVIPRTWRRRCEHLQSYSMRSRRFHRRSDGTTFM